MVRIEVSNPSAGVGLLLIDAPPMNFTTSEFIEAFTRAEVVEQAQQIQARYDNGADSYEAFGIDRA